MRFIICGFYFARGASCARAHAGAATQTTKSEKRETERHDATVLTGHVVTAEETQSTLS